MSAQYNRFNLAIESVIVMGAVAYVIGAAALRLARMAASELGHAVAAMRLAAGDDRRPT